MPLRGSVDVNATKTLAAARWLKASSTLAFSMPTVKRRARRAYGDERGRRRGCVRHAEFRYGDAERAGREASATKPTSDNGSVTWTIPCIAYEKTDGLSDCGVTATTQQISFVVKAVDGGSGKLA